MGGPPVLDRQPGESGPAFQARQTYVHQGPVRSLVRVGQELGKSVTLLGRWSSRWGWVQSAAAFDAMLADQQQRLAAAKLLADLQARRDKWLKRVEERPDLTYNIFVDASNDLAELVRECRERNVKPNRKEKASMQRAIVALDPLAARACEFMEGRLAREGLVEGTPEGLSEENVKAPGHVPGRRIATLRAFLEFPGSDKKKDDDRPK